MRLVGEGGMGPKGSMSLKSDENSRLIGDLVAFVHARNVVADGRVLPDCEW